MRVVLISTYDLGHQPFGLASPAAWLAGRGHQTHCADLAIDPLPVEAVTAADAVGFYLPMHTATRLAADAIANVRRLNPTAWLIAFGLYAPGNAGYLHGLGVHQVLGVEFEAALCDAVEGKEQPPPNGALPKLPFLTPDRSSLPSLARYPRINIGGDRRVAGYTEASRGCRHLCRHCPIVPVYQGAFRVVQPEVVLADIRSQVAAGAAHITFGDPDFFNGPTHAMRLVRAVHGEFPHLTYDVTIKVEHLLRHREYLPELRDTGCAFVTSAVESVEDEILEILDKGHTRADFHEVTHLFQAVRLTLSPTFVAFTPWTTREGYQDLLRVIEGLDLVDHVAPIQLALRLLLPPGSRLLELETTQAHLTGFDEAALLHRWRHPDPEMDALAARLPGQIAASQKKGWNRRQIFAQVWEEAFGKPPRNFRLMPRTVVPYLEEPWYC